MKKFILSLIILLTVVFSANAEYFNDIIVTSPTGIWTDNRAYTTLADAISAIGSTEQTLMIASPQTVTDLTIPSNINLKFVRTGKITYSGHLVINSPTIEAPCQQIFDATGIGEADYARGTNLRASWFEDLHEMFDQTVDNYVTLIIDRGWSANVDADAVVGDNVILKWEGPGNRIVINSGFTLSNIRNIDAGKYQIFSGSGDLDFLDGTILNLSWFSMLRSVITWVESEEVTLIVDSAAAVSYTNTIDENIYTVIISGGSLSPNAGVTLTIPGPLSVQGSLGGAGNTIVNGDMEVSGLITGTGNTTINGKLSTGLKKIFNLSGTLVISDGVVDYVYPDWWITNIVPGTTDMTTAINKAWETYDNIKLADRNYLISSTVEFPGSIKSLVGSGTHSSLVSNFAGAMIASSSGDDENFIFIKDIGLDGSNISTIGIDFRGISNSNISNVTITGCATGIRLTCAGTLSAIARSSTYNEIINIRITTGTTAIELGTDAGSTGSYCNANYILFPEISGMTTGISTNLADSININGGTIENITGNAINITDSSYVKVDNVYFDFLLNQAVVIDSNSENCIVQGISLPSGLKSISDSGADTIILNVDYSTQKAGVFSTGKELIENGGFDSDVSGWTTGGTSAAGGVSGNCLQLTNAAITAQQSIRVLTGRFYRWTAWVKSGTSGNESFRIYYGPTSDTAFYEGTSSATWTRYTIIFKAETSLNSFTLKKQGVGIGTMLFDEASVTEVSISNLGEEIRSSGSMGGLVTGVVESIGTPSGTTTYFDIPVRVPSGVRIIGTTLRVETALTAGETWRASYNGGSTQAIAVAGRPVAKDTRITTMYDANTNSDITNAITNVRITRDAGNFTNGVGVIRAEVYYEEFIPLATTP